MQNRRRAYAEETTSLATGWLVSCLLHGALALAALLFAQRLQLAPQSKSFQWDVAMVGSMAPSTVSASSQPATSPSSQPVTHSTHASSSISTNHASPVSQTQQPTKRTAEPVAEPTHQDSLIPPSQEQKDQFTAQQEPAESANHDSATMSSTAASSQTPTETAPQTAPASEPLASAQDGSAFSQSQSAPARADYGWLADLMAKWIADLDKRYPATLRTDGIQGKVTLAAILHEDGLLSDIRVVKSSGNLSLDQVALEDVTSGPPIKLSRPLDRPKMPVKFSIVYDLKTAR